MKKNIHIILLLMFCLIIVLVGCKNKQEDNKAQDIDFTIKKSDDKNMNIFVTDKILYFMTKDIVKDKHFVDYMFKNKQNGANFKYSKDSLKNIAKQDLFIYGGTALEPWASNFLDNLNKNKVGIINVSRGINLLAYNREVKYKSGVLRDNPYYWLNIDNYKIALLNIKNALQDKDPKNSNEYEKNFSKQLTEIKKYEDKLEKIHGKLNEYVFVYSEDELEYFIKYSNLDSIKITKNVKENRESIENKLLKEKKVIFLYSNKKELEKNKEIIKTYELKGVNLLICKENENYIKLLDYNINKLAELE